MMRRPVLPVDPQMVDETGRAWGLLSQAIDPSVVFPDALLVVGHPDDPLLARVTDIVPEGDDHIVRFDVFGPVSAVERAIHVA
jgi:hypothetical protein